MRALSRVLRRLGVLRVLLLAVAAALVLAAPLALQGAEPHGWRFFPTILGPVFATIMCFVLPMDITMSRIQMGEHDGAERARYRFVMRVETAALVLLVLAWAPFALRLLAGP